MSAGADDDCRPNRRVLVYLFDRRQDALGHAGLSTFTGGLSMVMTAISSLVLTLTRLFMVHSCKTPWP